MLPESFAAAWIAGSRATSQKSGVAKGLPKDWKVVGSLKMPQIAVWHVAARTLNAYRTHAQVVIGN